MLTDDYGNEIKEGVTLSIIVGIPEREVLARVISKSGRLYAHNEQEGDLSVREAVKWYPVEVVK